MAIIEEVAEFTRSAAHLAKVHCYRVSDSMLTNEKSMIRLSNKFGRVLLMHFDTDKMRREGIAAKNRKVKEQYYQMKEECVRLWMSNLKVLHFWGKIAEEIEGYRDDFSREIGTEVQLLLKEGEFVKKYVPIVYAFYIGDMEFDYNRMQTVLQKCVKHLNDLKHIKTAVRKCKRIEVEEKINKCRDLLSEDLFKLLIHLRKTNISLPFDALFRSKLMALLATFSASHSHADPQRVIFKQEVFDYIKSLISANSSSTTPQQQQITQFLLSKAVKLASKLNFHIDNIHRIAAEYHLSTGSYTEALCCYKEEYREAVHIAENHSTIARLMFDIGVAYFMSGKFSKATKWLKRIAYPNASVEKFGSEVTSDVLLSEIQSCGRPKEAEEAFNLCIDAAMNFCMLSGMKGRCSCYIQHEQWEKARECAESMIHSFSESVVGWVQLGRVLMGLERINEAESILFRIVNRRNESMKLKMEIFHLMGELKILQSQFAEAKKWLDREAVMNQMYVKHQLISATNAESLGKLYFEWGNFSASEANFQSALAYFSANQPFSPFKMTCYLYLSQICMLRNDIEKAERHIQAALAIAELYPHHSHTALLYACKAMIILQADGFSDAKRWLKIALQIHDKAQISNSSTAEIHHYFAVFYFSIGQYAKAELQTQAALRIHHQYQSHKAAKSYLLLADIREQIGDGDGAKSAIEAAYSSVSRSCPSHPIIQQIQQRIASIRSINIDKYR